MSRKLAELIRIGMSAFAKGDYQKAEQHLKEALEKGAEYPDIQYKLGLIEHNKGNYSQAVERFEKAVSLQPEYTEAMFSMSITLNDMGMYEEARSAYERASSIVSRHGISPEKNMVRGRIAYLHMELGKLYLALGQYDDAIFEYRKALDVAPEYHDLRVQLIVALRQAGRTEAALAEAETFLMEHPGNAAALIQKGILLFMDGERAKARGAWEEALYRDPLNKVVQIYLNTLQRDNTLD